MPPSSSPTRMVVPGLDVDATAHQLLACMLSVIPVATLEMSTNRYDVLRVQRIVGAEIVRLPSAAST
jgi:hypothetical protein